MGRLRKKLDTWSFQKTNKFTPQYFYKATWQKSDKHALNFINKSLKWYQKENAKKKDLQALQILHS